MNETNTVKKPDTVSEWVEELKDKDLDGWTCPYCDHDKFNTHQGRNNHIRYMHPGEKIPKMSQAETKARAALRLSRGFKPKRRKLGVRTSSPSDTADYKREKYYAMVDKYAAMGLNAHGEPYKMSPEGIKRVQAAQAARRAREGHAKRNGRIAPVEETMPHASSRKKIDPIVYHAPKEQYPINYCPNCGKGLEGYRK